MTSLDDDSPDVLELYRWAVQDPETHATVLRVMYERLRPGLHATVLREDFAGTSAEAVAWVSLKEGRRAFAIDLDGPTLAWARRRAERILGARAENITFIEGDSMRLGPSHGDVGRADIISVLNFSILYLRDEGALRSYLEHARECLSPTGIVVLNSFGGPGAVREETTRHRVVPTPRSPREAAMAPFDYLWEVRAYDAPSRTIECLIHFQLDHAGGKREVRDAFRYEWRMWSLSELVDVCSSAGFSNVQIWRHTYDPSKGAAGIFLGAVDAAAIDGMDQWTAYVVAAR